jgi:PKD repeat protein
VTAADIVRATSTGASNGTITGTFIAVSLPSGAVAGDQLLVEITTRDAMAGWRAPAGWTLIARPAESSGEGFFYRAAYGTDVTGTSWTFDNGAGNVTATKWAWSCVALRGNLVGSYLTGAAQAKTATSTTAPTPTISPAASCYLVAAVGVRITGTPDATWPAGWTEQTDLTADPGATNNVSSSLAVYDTTPTTAGSYTATPIISLSTGIGWAGIAAYAVGTPPGPVAPTADFTATPLTGISPLAVTFTDTSSGTPTSWAWTFGDSGTSTSQNPSHTYTSAGTYTVTLTATNAQGSDGETKTGYITVSAPGSLPGLIDGIEPEAHGHVPPYADTNGNLYRVTEEYLAQGNNPRMMKSTNGGATWAEVNAAGAPSGAGLNDLESGWTFQAGTVLGFMWTDDTTVFYCTFNTSDAASNPDTWRIVAETAITGLSAGSQAAASMVRLSDGRVRVFFSDTLSGSNHQLAYITKSSTTAAGGWSAKTAMTTTAQNQTGAVACVGASDKTHIFYHDYATKQVLYRTLTSADALSATTRADAAGTNTTSRNYNAVSNPVYYSASGTEVITALYASATGVRAITVVAGSVTTEQLVDSNTPLISPDNTDGNTGGDGPVFHLAVHDTTVHAIWADAATGDLYYSSRPHGGSWTARSVLWNASAGRAAFWAYNNVYVRGGQTVMGYTYDDGPHADDDSNTYYNRIVLAPSTPAGGAASGWSFTGAAVGKRNPVATGTGGWSFTGVATGLLEGTQSGSATSVWAFVSAAVGSQMPKATASGSWEIVSEAVGETGPLVVNSIVYVGNGTEWVPRIPQVWTGTDWLDIATT